MKRNVLKYSVVLLILFFIFVTVSVNAEIVSEGVCGENLTWTLDNNGTLTINGTGDMTDYSSSEVPWKSSRQNITSIIINNGVTSIGQAAFFDCDGLVSVKIPEGVIKIGRSAFLKCDNLSDIEISDSVTCIGALAFGRTAYYNDISNWENGVLYLGNYLLEADWLIEGECSIKQGTKCIGEEAFSERENLTGVIIPDSVLYIGDWAFQVCSNLKNVEMGNNIETIGVGAFNSCKNLTSIKLPNSLKSVELYAFYNCTALDKIYINDIAAYLDIQYGSEVDCPMYYADKLYLNNKRVVNITIPEGVKKIPAYSFDGCDSLSKVIVPDSVETIGENAFHGCNGLTSITLPFVGSSRTAARTNDAVLGYIFGYSLSEETRTIKQYYSSENYSYYYIPASLSEVKITDSIQIPYGAFYGCHTLISVAIEKKVAFIDKYAFFDCTNLEKVVISKNMAEIEAGAFENCNNIKTVKYKGNEKEWSEVYVGGNNGTLMTADIEYDYDTTVKTSCDVEIINNIVIVTPENVPDGCDIIFACYKDNIMIDMDCFTYQGTTIVPFATSCKYDKIKVMIWNNIKDMQPLCNIKCIEQL